MPSVKLPRKSTDTDMTPFVDVAFLILSFFMLATKFKPPDPVEIKTPGSVNSTPLPEENAILILIDSTNRVFFSVLSQKDPEVYARVIEDVNTTRSLNLTAAEKKNFERTYAIGVPFGGLKQLLGLSQENQDKLKQPGIPILDSANNELIWWVGAAKRAFSGQKMQILIKGDNTSKWPAFKNVVAALKRNDELKYNLITAMDNIPSGSELEKYNTRSGGNKPPAPAKKAE